MRWTPVFGNKTVVSHSLLTFFSFTKILPVPVFTTATTCMTFKTDRGIIKHSFNILIN
jgi:hypothetical protein